MHNFGRRTRVQAAVVVVSILVSAAAGAQTARERYESATERDAKVRTLLADSPIATPAADVIAHATHVMTSFEILVRRFPTSGYADNALFQAASLAEVTHEKFARPQDRARAVRYYEWLVKEYPTSPLVKQASAQLESLTAPAAVPLERGTRHPPSPQATVRPAETPTDEPAILASIERTVMASGVRVTIQLDREVHYLEHKLSGPARVFFDLRNVQTVPDLKDKVLTYTSDVINKIRVGRHPDSVVRVVLDLEDVASYSVFTLYNPFRIVIDAGRTAARAATMDLPPLPSRRLGMFSASPETPRLLSYAAPPLAPAARAVRMVEPRLAAAVSSVTPAPPSRAAAAPVTPSTNAAGGFSIARQLGLSVSRIVIDPGHGGHDPGVLGKGLGEATLVLDVALRLERLLQKEPGVEVVLTRRTDVYVPLEERTEIANRQNADMFLSIHANASRNADARGIETFYLSFASSPDAEAVAARENSASTREMNQLPDLIKAITLNNKLDESRDLANMVQDALVTNLRKTNRQIRGRGVKKAPFVVLIGAAMPSVLAEISFVSNRQELTLLKTPAYRQKIAEALFDAVAKYRKSLKNQTMTELRER
ncbi:MAG: N-acetylmuramoyl-L-alanine amidase [Vicinamibacterales bacterium]